VGPPRAASIGFVARRPRCLPRAWLSGVVCVVSLRSLYSLYIDADCGVLVCAAHVYEPWRNATLLAQSRGRRGKIGLGLDTGEPPGFRTHSSIFVGHASNGEPPIASMIVRDACGSTGDATIAANLRRLVAVRVAHAALSRSLCIADHGACEAK
jgi:hypothetical protein